MAAGQNELSSSNSALTSKMDANLQAKMINFANFEELTLIDPESNASYIIRVSETDAQRARNDMDFASSLLRYARKIQKVADYRKTKENRPPNSASPLERKMTKKNDQAASTVSSQSVEHSRKELGPRSLDCSGSTELEPENFDCSVDSTLAVQSTPPPAESSESTDTATDTSNTDAMHIWSKNETLLLVTVYQENEAMFNNGKVSQENCWNQVSQLIKKKGYDISGHKCATKLQALNRTYKKITDHNGKSGNRRKDWEYFAKMDELFAAKPWVSPLTTARSDSNNFDQAPERPSKYISVFVGFGQLLTKTDEYTNINPMVTNTSLKRAKLTPASEYLRDLLKHKKERAQIRDAQHEQRLEALSKLRDVMCNFLEKK